MLEIPKGSSRDVEREESLVESMSSGIEESGKVVLPGWESWEVQSFLQAVRELLIVGEKRARLEGYHSSPRSKRVKSGVEARASSMSDHKGLLGAGNQFFNCSRRDAQ